MSELDVVSADKQDESWQLKALTEALGELTLTVKDSLSVGRGTDNDVVLGSKEVSRNHALLSVLNGELYVKDLASSNGTFINDERITSNESTSLQANDNIRFASFSFEVMVPVANKNVDASETDADTEINTDTHIDSVTETNIDTIHSVDTNDVDTASVDIDTNSSDTYTDIEKLSAGVTSTDPVIEPISSATIEPVEPVVVEDTVVEDTMIENEEVAAKSAALLAQDAQPVIKSTIIGEVLSASDSNNIVDSSSETISTESLSKDTTSASITENRELDNHAAAMPIAAAMATEPTASTTTPSTAREKETVMSSEIPKQPLAEELPMKEPTVSKLMGEEPMKDAPVTNDALMQDKASHQESVVNPEHDKTTTTALQEEADPEVLRAKQAATGQFSGTANLGAGRDLGTEGNNAMDQAIDNPANAAHPDKKPSGSWFIWVFIAIIIIGIALWLFNMGGA